MNSLIERCRKAGIRLWAEGDALRYDAPKGAMTPDLLSELKANKLDMLAELRRPWKPPPRDGYGPGALRDTVMARQVRNTRQEAPGPSIGACMARLSEAALDDMGWAAVEAAREAEAVEEFIAEHPGTPGISPEFQARLDAQDLEDIKAGDIPIGTVQAFEAAAIAREAEDLKEFFEERSTILEHDAGLPRADADLEAARITSTYARNGGCLWASLRAALADYPVLLAQVPETSGPVDALPFGVAKVAVLKGRRVVRQGAFSGAHEVPPRS